jgi:hypothetical protein
MTMVDDRTVILHQIDEPAEPEAPRFFDSLDLVALSTAVSCACVFVAATMRSWNAGFIEHQAVTLTRELTTQAVTATGYTKPDWYHQEHLSFITVRVFGFKERIGIEVWDNMTEPATLPASDNLQRELHGLGLVEARAKDWGSAVTPQGRVTWAALDVYERTRTGLPIRTRKPTPYPRPPARHEDHPSRDVDFLRRVRDGIERL